MNRLNKNGSLYDCRFYMNLIGIDNLTQNYVFGMC